MTASPDKILLTSFKNDSLKKYTGLTLEKISQMMGKSPVETAIDLVINDRSRVGVVYFLMSEDNVKKFMRKPWVSFGSDEESSAPEGVFLKYNVHPRAYGNVARLLGKYVREEKLISLQEAIRRLTSLPAENLNLMRRGKIEKGYFADLVIFNPDEIQDHAIYDKPHQFSTGIQYVIVNGVPVIMKGRHTGETPGRFIKGPGWKNSNK
jgi:N-acyl-D-amino-acid deacylase